MTHLPEHLHAAYDWTDAAGELDTLTYTPSPHDYARDSAEHCADTADGDVTVDDLLGLREWLRLDRPSHRRIDR